MSVGGVRADAQVAVAHGRRGGGHVPRCSILFVGRGVRGGSRHRRSVGCSRAPLLVEPDARGPGRPGGCNDGLVPSPDGDDWSWMRERMDDVAWMRRLAWVRRCGCAPHPEMWQWMQESSWTTCTWAGQGWRQCEARPQAAPAPSPTPTAAAGGGYGSRSGQGQVLVDPSLARRQRRPLHRLGRSSVGAEPVNYISHAAAPDAPWAGALAGPLSPSVGPVSLSNAPADGLRERVSPRSRGQAVPVDGSSVEPQLDPGLWVTRV